MSDAIKPDLPTPQEAVATAKAIIEKAKKNPPIHPGKYASVAEEADEYLKLKRDEAAETSPLFESTLLNKFRKLKDSVVEKMLKDKNEPPRETILPTKNGRVVFAIDFTEDGSKLHVTEFTFGGRTREITKDMVITDEELSIFIKGSKTGKRYFKRISAKGAQSSKKTQITPDAVEKAEALIRLYLDDTIIVDIGKS